MAKSGKTYTFPDPAPSKRSGAVRHSGRTPQGAKASDRKTYTFPDPSTQGIVRQRRRYEDEHATVGPFGTEITGWHLDEETKAGPRWTCDYGCKSHIWIDGPAPWAYHTPECPYWQREGCAGRPLLRSGTREPLTVPWRCAYGCKPFVWTEKPYPGQYHRWDCAFWSHEGADATPF